MARHVSPELPARSTGLNKYGARGWSDHITKNAHYMPGLVGPATEPDASGTKYYVSKNGDNSNSGTSKDAPLETFESVSDGAHQASSGDVIVILDTGDEYDVVLNDSSGRFQPEDSGITVCGEDGTFPKVKVNWLDSTAAFRCFYPATFRGFAVEGPNTNPGGANDGEGWRAIRFDNVNTGGSFPTTKEEAKAGGWVYNVQTTHMGNSAIMWGGTSVGGVVEHVHSAYNYGPSGTGGDADGIQFSGAPNEKCVGGWIENCLTNHNSDDGIDLYRSMGVRVINCFNYAAGYREDGSTTGVDVPGKGIKIGGGDDIDIGGNVAIRCISVGNGGAGFGANGSNLPVDFIYCTAFFNARKSERDYEKDFELWESGHSSPSGFNLQESRLVGCIAEQGLYDSVQSGSIDSSNVIACNFDENNNFSPQFSNIPLADDSLDSNDYPTNENWFGRIDVREDESSLPGIISAGSTGYQPTPASQYHEYTDVVDYVGSAPDLGAFETSEDTSSQSTAWATTNTLSAGNAYRDVVNSYGTDSDTFVDVTGFNGATLAQKMDAAISDAQSSGMYPVFVIPEGTYDWDTAVTFTTTSLRGPTVLAHQNANITVTSTWAFDLDGFTDASLSPDVDSAFRLIGGVWDVSSGVLRQYDSFRGEFSPDEVIGGVTSMRLLNTGDEFCEGWTFRDTDYQGVDEPLEMDPSSADQQLLANLSFDDFSIGYNADFDGSTNPTTQNWSAVNCTFSNARGSQIGMFTGNYCTGSAFATTWNTGSGAVFDFNDSGTNPSLIDSDVASGATLATGQYSWETTSGQAFTQAQNSDIVNNGGPSLPRTTVRSDSYSGSTLEDRVSNAIADISGDGAVIIPSGDHSWDSTLNVDVSGKSIVLVTSPTTKIDITASNFAVSVSGDGSFGVYGGRWIGNSGQSGCITSTATDLDVFVKDIRNMPDGVGIEYQPSVKGDLRVFDTKFHSVGNNTTDGCIRIGGSGASYVALTTIEFSYTDTCVRFDSAVDDFEGLRVSSHTMQDGSIFANANAAVSGTWHNIKFESQGYANQTVFDNTGQTTVADATEPFVTGGGSSVQLWADTKPQFFPEINTQSSTKYEP